MQGRKVLIFNDSEILGVNPKSFGYRSIGDNVPDVMITLEKRLNKGDIARDESRHANCITGSIIPGIEEPFGSIIIANRAIPSEYVLNKVAKSATSVKELKSSRFVTCNVCKSEFNLEYANFNGFASREVLFIIR